MSRTAVGAREVVQAWGRILARLSPQPLDRDHQRVSAALPGLLRLRRRASRRRRHAARAGRLQGRRAGVALHGAHRSAPAAARLDRRRRAARPLPRARQDPAAAGRARHSHAARDERRAADSRGMDRPAPAAGRRVDRRPAAGARRAAHAGHLRPHPQAHRRAPDHRALHGDAAAGAARRATSRSSCDFWQANAEHAPDLDQPVHAAGRRDLDGAADARPTARRSSPTCGACGRCSRSCRCSTAC